MHRRSPGASERAPAPVLGVEVDRAPGEPANERVHLVRVLDVKRRVLHELADLLHVAREVRHRLQAQPLVHHEVVILEAVVKLR